MMIGGSVTQAEQRLAAAQASLQRFEAADAGGDTSEMEAAWREFLTHAGTAFGKIEQGTKCCGSCTGWFGTIRKFRSEDPLLCYLHHARNAEEHTLEQVVVSAPQKLELSSEAFGIGFSFVNQQEPTPQPVKVTMGGGGREVDVTERFVQTHSDKRVVLRAVRDRSVFYEPPLFHLGQQLQDYSPAAVGKLGLDYLRGLLETAVKRHP